MVIDIYYNNMTLCSFPLLLMKIGGIVIESAIIY